MVIYGIIGSSEVPPNIFQSKYVPLIAEAMDDSNTQFLFSDHDILVARYLAGRGFRNCIMYHTGSKPKHHFGNYETRGDFSSLAELTGEILNIANVVIKCETHLQTQNFDGVKLREPRNKI
jgi:hypothetical protein